MPRSASIRRSVAVAGWLLGFALLLNLPGQAQGQVVTQTPGRDLNFGICEYVVSATYTVAAAASPGAGACTGATSAEFTVTHSTPGPHQRIRIRFSPANGNATVDNPPGPSIGVSLTKDVADGGFCMAAGGLTVYVGGSVTLPGGVTVFGTYTGPGTLDVVYTGPTNCP